MPKSFEEISRYASNSGGRPDANLANDALHLGGIAAEEYATKSWVKTYHERMELALREYLNTQDQSILSQAKAYTDAAIRGQDFSSFAKITDVQALNQNLTSKINQVDTNQKNYTDGKINQVVQDTNANFEEVNSAISGLNTNVNKLFQSVSSGKAKVAEAITDKGVSTSADASFDEMANNIRSIESGGSIPPGYVNTSDATATASDILNGKTAYVNGQKVYGKFVYSGNSGGGQYNPDNPFPENAEVELVYANTNSTLEQKVMFNNIDSSEITTISGDKNVLIRYNEDTQKLETYYRSNNGYVKVQNQYGESKTPDFSLSELGIEQDTIDNYKLVNMACSKMNTNGNISGYECKIALNFVIKSSGTSPLEIVYVFTMSTNVTDGIKIGLQNEDYSAGVEGNIEQYTTYKRWKISWITGTSSISYLQQSAVDWSPYSERLKVIRRTGSGSDDYTIEIYELNSFAGAEDGYGYTIKKDNYSGIYSGNNFTFLNVDRIGCIYSSSSGESRVIIYDENFNKVNEVYEINDEDIRNYMITPDAQYICHSTGIYHLTVDYNTGNLILGTKICDNNLSGYSTLSYSINFSLNQEFFAFNRWLTGGIKVIQIYKFDISNTTSPFTLIVEKEISSFSKNISGDSWICFDDLNNLTLIDSNSNTKKLIGIKYNGDMYYKDFNITNKLTATQQDVVSGKTFIGMLGTAQTGTMEVQS